MVSEELILHLQQLANLSISDSQDLDDLKKELNSIITMVDKLAELDTKGVEPMLHIRHANQEFLSPRRDIVGTHLDRDTALIQSINSKSPFFRVPKVLNNKK